MGPTREAGTMTRPKKVPWVSLTTRLPPTLRRAVKLHCVEIGTSLEAFVAQAIDEKLARDQSPPLTPQ